MSQESRSQVRSQDSEETFHHWTLPLSSRLTSNTTWVLYLVNTREHTFSGLGCLRSFQYLWRHYKDNTWFGLFEFFSQYFWGIFQSLGNSNIPKHAFSSFPKSSNFLPGLCLKTSVGLICLHFLPKEIKTFLKKSFSDQTGAENTVWEKQNILKQSEVWSLKQSWRWWSSPTIIIIITTIIRSPIIIIIIIDQHWGFQNLLMLPLGILGAITIITTIIITYRHHHHHYHSDPQSLKGWRLGGNHFTQLHWIQLHWAGLAGEPWSKRWWWSFWWWWSSSMIRWGQYLVARRWWCNTQATSVLEGNFTQVYIMEGKVYEYHCHHQH